MAAAFMICTPSNAQLTNHLSIGNAKALALGNAVTADPPGIDSIHFNPAGLATIHNTLRHYKLQTGYIDHQGAVSGMEPGVPYQPIPEFRQDPALKGQQSRPVSTERHNVYLPIIGNLELPFLIAPGFGWAQPLGDSGSGPGHLVFGNAAYMTNVFGYTRSADNIGSYNAQTAGTTNFSYVNPTLAMEVADNLYLGASLSLAWHGYYLKNRLRSISPSLAKIDTLVAQVDPQGRLGLELNPYSEVGVLAIEASSPFAYSFTFGVLWKPTEWLSFGMTYRSPSEADVKGDYRIDYDASFYSLLQKMQPVSAPLAIIGGDTLAAQPSQQGTVKFRSSFADWLALGLSLKATPRLTVNLDIKKVNFSELGERGIFFDQSLDYLSILSALNTITKSRVDGYNVADPDALWARTGYRDVIDWSLGIAYQWSDRLTLRVGYEPRTTPIPDERRNLVQPTADAELYGLGFSYRLSDKSTLDLAAAYFHSEMSAGAGTSKSANSLVEGETSYNPYRGLDIEHELQSWILSVNYEKAL